MVFQMSKLDRSLMPVLLAVACQSGPTPGTETEPNNDATQDASKPPQRPDGGGLSHADGGHGGGVRAWDGSAAPAPSGLPIGLDAGADSGANPECVQIFTPRTPSQVGLHPFWLDDSGVHIAWGRYTGDIAISTFSAETGESIGETLYPDPAARGGLTGVQDVAASPDGAIVIPVGDEERKYHSLLFTHLDSPNDVVQVDTSWLMYMVNIVDIAWDGEAFAVHGKQGGTLLVARYSETGAQLTELQPVAPAVTGLADHFDFATDPASGRTWMAGTSAPGVFMTGYIRDLSPIAAVAEGTPVHISSGEAIAKGVSPALAVGPQGLAVGYSQYRDGTYLLELTEELEVQEVSFLPVKDVDHGLYNFSELALVWLGGWWLAGANFEGIQLYELTPDGLQDRGSVVVHREAQCYPGNCTTDVYPSLRPKGVSLLRWREQLWLGFRDSSEAENGGVPSPYPYRVVKVAAGCQYLSVQSMRSAGLPVPTTNLGDR